MVKIKNITTSKAQPKNLLDEIILDSDLTGNVQLIEVKKNTTDELSRFVFNITPRITYDLNGNAQKIETSVITGDGERKTTTYAIVDLSKPTYMVNGISQDNERFKRNQRDNSRQIQVLDLLGRQKPEVERKLEMSGHSAYHIENRLIYSVFLS